MSKESKLCQDQLKWTMCAINVTSSPLREMTTYLET